MHGEGASAPEVTIISSRGFWLYFNNREYFLSYEDFPWFKNAKINEILDVQVFHYSHV
jgi:hypothetical protein